jgi:hypothetical protein
VLKGAEKRFIGERYVYSILWNSILSMIMVLRANIRQQICRGGEFCSKHWLISAHCRI